MNKFLKHFEEEYTPIFEELENELANYSVDFIASTIECDYEEFLDLSKEEFMEAFIWFDENLMENGEKIFSLFDCGYSAMDVYEDFNNMDDVFFWDYTNADFDPEEQLGMTEDEFESLLECGTVTDVGWAYIQSNKYGIWF